MVKNPVLLLNYLYQHSYISRPSYPLIFERKNPPYFIVSCVVDEVRTHGTLTFPVTTGIFCHQCITVSQFVVFVGTGSSKKEAKTHSAKLMLNLIQNSEGNVLSLEVD